MNPHVCAVIVTYQSTPHIAPLLQELLGQVQHLYIVDNGSDAAMIAFLQAFSAQHPGRITLILNENNYGIATAQNQGIRKALAGGYEWVLLMDDDSVPEAGMVQSMLTQWQKQQDKSIGVIAPCLVEQNIPVVSRYIVPWCHVGFQRKKAAAKTVLRDVAMVIASGSMIHADVFRRIGLMREGFFIDYVDYEFCLRAKTQGIGIMVVGDAVLQHHHGNKQRKKWMGMEVITLNSPALRYYYMFRNRIFFLRLYGVRFPFVVLHELLACTLSLLRLVSVETDKAMKLRALLCGMREGMTQPIPLFPASDSNTRIADCAADISRPCGRI